METPDNKTPQQEIYSLSVGDLQKKPAEIVDYKLGDKVNRENLISLLTLSFRVSMGRPMIQSTFFRWIRMKYGFEYKTALRSLFAAGGWQNLADVEKEYFLQAFKAVPAHSQMPEEMNNNISAQFEPQLSQIIYNDVDIFVYADINSIPEFIKRARKYIEENPSDQFKKNA